MQIELESGVRLLLNKDDHTASVFESLKASGDVFIPRFVESGGEKYIVKSLAPHAFLGTVIRYLTFPDDSEVVSFEKNCFMGTYVNKLQIPSNLKYLKDGWCRCLSDLNEVEISPKNKIFSYIEDKFLVGKSQSDIDKYDILYYARFDIEEAVIPSQITTVKQWSFSFHENLKSVIFPDNSELKTIENNVFTFSPIEKLVLPATVEDIDGTSFQGTDVILAPKSTKFSIQNNLLLRKSDGQIFDLLVFSKRDIEAALVPSSIKEIAAYAFAGCTRLKSISFDENSSCQKICEAAFMSICCQDSIVIPSSVKTVEKQAFSDNSCVKFIEFLGEHVEIGANCFSSCEKLESITFSNAKSVVLNDQASMDEVKRETKIRVKKDAIFNGPGVDKIKDQIVYI